VRARPLHARANPYIRSLIDQATTRQPPATVALEVGATASTGSLPVPAFSRPLAAHQAALA